MCLIDGFCFLFELRNGFTIVRYNFRYKYRVCFIFSANKLCFIRSFYLILPELIYRYCFAYQPFICYCFPRRRRFFLVLFVICYFTNATVVLLSIAKVFVF